MAAHPSLDDFTPLAEHESQTPTSFFGGKPVLHAHATDCRLLSTGADLAALQAFGSLATVAQPQTNGDADNGPARVRCDNVQVFVNSADVLLANKTPSGDPRQLRIPYQSISIHATQRVYPNDATVDYTPLAPQADAPAVHAIMLQIDPGYSMRAHENPDLDDMDADATLVLIPPHADGASTEAAAQEIFEAMSRCADLHPDPDDDDEDDAAAMPAIGGGVPGEGGWITSENAHEFADRFGDAEDEDVDALVSDEAEGLGQGAGTRRARDAASDDHAEPSGDDETKWQRTS